MSELRIGISGWRYPGWRGSFYPPGLPQRTELEYASARLNSLELNGTFYSLQRPENFRSWVAQTPPGFVFAVKGGRFITHMKRLSGLDAVLPNFFASGLLALGPKLGPILWQLPPTLAFDADLLARFCAALPRSTGEAAELARRHDERLDGRALTETDADRPLRHALEVRHASFAAAAESGELEQLLRPGEVALVVADSAGRFPVLDLHTAGFVYARLHGDAELYTSGYTPQALDRWAERVRAWSDPGRDVFVYFDNDAKAHAPRDAMALAQRLNAGLGNAAG